MSLLRLPWEQGCTKLQVTKELEDEYPIRWPHRISFDA